MPPKYCAHCGAEVDPELTPPEDANLGILETNRMTTLLVKLDEIKENQEKGRELLTVHQKQIGEQLASDLRDNYKKIDSVDRDLQYVTRRVEDESINWQTWLFILLVFLLGFMAGVIAIKVNLGLL